MIQPQFLDPLSIDPRHKDHPGPYMIKAYNLKQIFPEYQDAGLTEEIRKLRGPGMINFHGMMDPDEANILMGILKATKPEIIFEIGTSLRYVDKIYG